jgi:hypothetical protein
MSYHHYSLTLSGRLLTTEEGTCDANKSESTRTQLQRAPASSSIKFALRLDPSTSSSGKWDTTATSVEWDPQRFPLAAMVSI